MASQVPAAYKMDRMAAWYLFFFLWAERDPWPLSESDEQEESLESLELEVEQLDESDAMPVSSLTSIEAAMAANSGSFS